MDLALLAVRDPKPAFPAPAFCCRKHHCDAAASNSTWSMWATLLGHAPECHSPLNRNSSGRAVRTPFRLRSSRGGGGSRPPFAARRQSLLRLRRRRSDHRRCGTIRPPVPCGRPRGRPGRAQWRLPQGQRADKGIRTEAARRTGRRQEKLSTDRAATRSCHIVPSFGVVSFSPNGPSGVAPMDRSPTFRDRVCRSAVDRTGSRAGRAEPVRRFGSRS
jgi:hypothetical protein